MSTEQPGALPSGICTIYPPVTMVTWKRKGHTVKISKESECIEISMKETKIDDSEATGASRFCMKPRQSGEGEVAGHPMVQQRGARERGGDETDREKYKDKMNKIKFRIQSNIDFHQREGLLEGDVL